MTDILNKTLRTLLSATVEGERAAAAAALQRLAKDRNIVLVEENSALFSEKAALQRQLLEMKENMERWKKQLSGIHEAISLHKINVIEPTKNNEFHGNAKQWMLDRLAEAGENGISRSRLYELTKPFGPDAKKSVTKRWSEIQNEGYGFLISDGVDEVMASAVFSERYAKQFEEHEARRLDKINAARIRRKEMTNG